MKAVIHAIIGAVMVKLMFLGYQGGSLCREEKGAVFTFTKGFLFDTIAVNSYNLFF